MQQRTLIARVLLSEQRDVIISLTFDTSDEVRG